MKQLSVHTARYAITILLMGGLCLSFGRGVFAANGINKVIMFQGKVTNSNGTNVTDGVYDFEFKLYNAAGGGSTLFTETWSNAALWTSTMSSAPGNGGTQLTYSTGTNESSIKVGQILWNTTKQESVIVTAVDTGANTVDISPTRQAWNTSDTVTNRIYVKDGVFRVALNSLNSDLSGVNFGTDNIFLGVNFNSDGEMKPRIQYSAVPYAFNAEKVNGLTVTNTADNPFGSTTTLKIGDGKTVSIANSLSFSGTDSTAFTLPTGSDTLVGLTATQNLTNKTIGSTGLVFSGATTDITSFTDEDLTITPNGTGSLVLSSDFNSGVKIGSSTNTLAGLSVTSGIGSNAGFIVNQLLSGDLLVASAAGVTKFTIFNDGSASMSGTLTLGNDGILRSSAGDLHLAYKSGLDAWTSGLTLLDNSGNVGIGTTNPLFGLDVNGTTRLNGAITASAYTTANGLLTTDGSGLISQTAAGTGTDCLRGDLSWGSCGSGASGGGGDRPHAIYSAATGTNVQVEFTGAVDSAPALGATLVLPSNTSRIRVVTRGAGGGGGGISNTNAIKVAGGGGEGGYSEEMVTSLGSTYYYTVGAAGTAGSTAGGNGGVGGTTCFGTNSTACTTPMLSATGGIGGTGSTAVGVRAGGAGGAGSGGNVNTNGNPGANSSSVANAVWGGAGGGNGGAIATTASGNGTAGTTGGGGSGGAQITAATTTRTGGAGGAGYIIIYVYTSSGSTTELWDWNNGAISPSNLNNDLLLGGVSTAAAKFAFINNMVGTPTASISANTTNNALFITGDGAISRTNRQNLVLGNSTTYNSTGNILLNPNGVGNVGIGLTNPSYTLDVATPSLTTNGARGVNVSSTFAPTGGGTQNGVYVDITNAPSTTNNTANAMYLNVTDNTTLGGINSLYGLNTNLILSGNANKNAYGANFSLTDDSNTSGTLQGINIGVTRTGDTNSFVTSTYGLRLSAQTSGAATSSTQNIFGIDLQAASQNMVSGTTNIYGIRVNGGSSSVGASATLNYYGLYVDSQTFNTTGTTTGTGLYVNSVTGADNNYAAIFAGGRIGIGTTTPHATVDIKGQKDGARAGLIIDQLATGTGSDIFTASAAGVTRFTLFNDGSASTSGGLTIGDAGVLRASTGALNFDYKSGANTWSRGLTLLDNSGNVGIGTTSPGSKLDVEFSSAPVTDMVNFSNIANGTSTTLVDGLQIDFATTGTTASADNSGLRVNVTSDNSGATTVLTGIDIANLVSAEANSTETGLRIGTSWDRGIIIESGGSTNSGLVYSGAGRPTKTVTLSPEFAGAILTASGSATITGSMTSDASASAALSNYRTYYEWTSSQTSLQDYSVALRVTLPKDFSAWATSDAIRVNYNTELTGTAPNKLDVVVYNTDTSLSAQEQATPVSMRQDLSSGSVKTWTTNSIDDSELDAGNTRDLDLAGETMLIYLKMYSKDNSHVQIGDIELNYLASF